MKKRQNIILNYDETKVVDIKKFQEQWQEKGSTIPRMMKGAPIVINVKGIYIKLNDLPSLVRFPNQKFLVQQYVCAIQKQDENLVPHLYFKWVA